MSLRSMLFVFSAIIISSAHAHQVETALRNWEGFSPYLTNAKIKSTYMKCIQDDGAVFVAKTSHSLSHPEKYLVQTSFRDSLGKTYGTRSNDWRMKASSADLAFGEDSRGDEWDQFKHKKYANLTLIAASKNYQYYIGWTIEEGFNPVTSEFHPERNTLTLTGRMRSHFHVVKKGNNLIYIDQLGTCKLSIIVDNI